MKTNTLRLRDLERTHCTAALAAWRAATPAEAQAAPLMGRGHAPRGQCYAPALMEEIGAPIASTVKFGRRIHYTHAGLAARVKEALARARAEYESARRAAVEAEHLQARIDIGNLHGALGRARLNGGNGAERNALKRQIERAEARLQRAAEALEAIR